MKFRPKQGSRSRVRRDAEVPASDRRGLKLSVMAQEVRDDGVGASIKLHSIAERNPPAAASSWFRQETVYSATLTGNAERVKALLQAKREVVAEQLQWRDDVGCCALHRACREGHIECTRLLLDAHADLDAADNVGWQPLHHACSNGRLECARLLLEKFADADATNLRGNTPMHLALMGIGHTGDKLQALLVSHGATSGPPAWLKGDSPPRKPRRERVQKYANEQAPEQAPDAGDDHLKE